MARRIQIIASNPTELITELSDLPHGAQFVDVDWRYSDVYEDQKDIIITIDASPTQ